METQQKLVQSQTIIPVGEHLFDEELHLTGIDEFGVSFEELMSGRASLPPQGARFDVAYEGAVEGDRIKGYIKGLDYVRVSADGSFQLNIYATLRTDDGEKVAVSSSGVLYPPKQGSSVAELRLNMQFATASPAYTWVNALQAWGTGSVDFETREISMKIYAA